MAVRSSPGLELAVGVAIVLSFRPLAYLPDLSNRLSPGAVAG